MNTITKKTLDRIYESVDTHDNDPSNTSLLKAHVADVQAFIATAKEACDIQEAHATLSRLYRKLAHMYDLMNEGTFVKKYTKRALEHLQLA